jgi:recombination protein RecR
MEISTLEKLIKIIAKLPGLGPRSARRIAIHLIKNTDNIMLPLAEALKNVAQEIKVCGGCGNIDIHDPCSICSDAKRDGSQLCIVEDVSDLWAMERGNIFKGFYHILGGTLSALDGRTPETLNFESLKQRVANSDFKEVIVATNATLEGQTTGFYIVDMLKPYDIKITRLANGIPMGAELDYMDEGTLSLALKMRQDY